MKAIVSLLCKELAERVKVQIDITLTVRDSVKQFIVEKGTDKKYGARPLRRAIQNELEDKLAEAILEGSIKRGTNVVVGMTKQGITFTTK